MQIRIFIILMVFSCVFSIAGIVLLGLNFSPENADSFEKALLLISLFFSLASFSCLILFYLKQKFSKNKPIFQQASSSFLLGLIISGVLIGGLLVRKYIL